MTRTIGLVFPGDASAPSTWSGIPAGLTRGFEELGLDVLHVRAAPPRSVERAVGAGIAPRYRARARALGVQPPRSGARTAAKMGPAIAGMRSAAASVAVARSRDADAYVQIGTGYLLATRRPVVTCEDMTIHQAIRSPGYVGWKVMTPRARRARIAIAQRAYRHAVVCGGLSDWVTRSIAADFGVAPDKARVMGIGANHAPPDRQRDWSTPRLLWIGLDWERKQGDAVVRAFSRLRVRRPGATLDLVGAHPRVDVEGVQGHGVLRLGDPAHAARLADIWGRATCFVMPSRVEPVGIVYAEALAAGIASIGTTHGGCPLVIGDAGIAVDPADEAALDEALRRVTDPETAAHLGAQARVRAPLFTWRAVAERHLRALGHETWHGRPLAGYL